MFQKIIIFVISITFCPLLKAEDLQLSELANDIQWKSLLHYADNNQSKVYSSDFFISVNGNKDLLAELSATVSSLLSQNSDTQCRFPARYEWLASKLDSVARLPKKECASLSNWLNAINPSKVTLIFASSFMNNPASAFGHTFLRLDQKNSEDLLAYSANFAAQTNDDNALSYALKGIFGGYAGFYSITPYYIKVKEYGDLENRDIWEYELDFKDHEIRRLLLHLWELRNIAVPYYYFDENCSYKILELLAVARPELKPYELFKSWVIPVDTVRSLQPHITNVKYRPSAESLLIHRIKQSTEIQKKTASDIADLKTEYDLQSADAESLDLAYELLSYRRLADELTFADEIINKRSFDILSVRGTKHSSDKIPDIEAPAMRPEQGHKSSQLAFEQGRKRDLWFSRFSLRPALHDLTDPKAGYQAGSQINFFEFVLDATESEQIDLAYLTALEITSLSARDDFFKPLSWNVRTGLKRNIIQFRDESLTSYLGGSLGYSWNSSNKSILYTLLDSEIRANKHYESDINPGTGFRTGIIGYLSESLIVHPEIQWLRFLDQKALYSSLSLGYSIGNNLNLVAKFRHQNEYDRNDFISTLGIEMYVSPR